MTISYITSNNLQARIFLEGTRASDGHSRSTKSCPATRERQDRMGLFNTRPLEVLNSWELQRTNKKLLGDQPAGAPEMLSNRRTGEGRWPCGIQESRDRERGEMGPISRPHEGKQP